METGCSGLLAYAARSSDSFETGSTSVCISSFWSSDAGTTIVWWFVCLLRTMMAFSVLLKMNLALITLSTVLISFIVETPLNGGVGYHTPLNP